jgi:tetratricopeptide (TPR) repeat protein/transcriptional regulator with XRE-family HTH domain
VAESRSFGVRLRELRVAAGVTQEQLAARSGISVRAIGDLERDRVRRPHRDSVDLLAGALDLGAADRDDLLRRARLVPQSATSGGVGRDDAADRASVPRQLPAPVRHFTGRAEHVKALTELLDDGADAGGTVVISAIGGTAGIGKTALAIHWANQVAERFPDGQLYVNLRGFDPDGAPMGPDEAIRGFLEALGVPPREIPARLDEQAALFRSHLADRRVLVVLDNARDAEQVRPLLPGRGSMVVVTSRDPLAGLVAAQGAHPLALDLLTPAEARDLLARRLGPETAARHPRTIDELIELCARLPLALNIAAAHAALHPARPLADLVAQLRDTRARLDVLDAGDAATDIRSVFSWSYDQLGAAAARMFRLLGLYPGPDISLPVTASLAGASRADARRALAELTRAHLLAEHTPGRYAFHDLLRAYAAEQADTHDSETERHAATRRLLDHYLHTVDAIGRGYFPSRYPREVPAAAPGTTPEEFGDRDAALAWCEAERAGLRAAVALAERAGFTAHAWQIPVPLAAFFDQRSYWEEWADLWRVSLRAAERADDPAGQAMAHFNLGHALKQRGTQARVREHLSRALELFEQLGEHARAGGTHDALAHSYELDGRPADALVHARRCLELFRIVGDRTGQARALSTVGWDLALLGQYEEALASCQEALEPMREGGDRWGEAAALDTAGYACAELGRFEEAIGYFRQAVSISEELDDRYNRAQTLIRLGDVYRTLSDVTAARDAWREAFDIFTALDHRNAGRVRAKLDELGPASGE